MVKRMAALILIFAVLSIAWFILGGAMFSRSEKFGPRLRGEVAGLWGDAQTQRAPEIEFCWWTSRVVDEEVTDPKTQKRTLVKKTERVLNTRSVSPAASDISVDLNLEQRQKGLLWYSTYGVKFSGDYAYVHEEPEEGFVRVLYRFPTTQATYENFVFSVNGVEQAGLAPETRDGHKIIVRPVPVRPGDRVDFRVAYGSRGLDSWRYSFGADVNRIRDFSLVMNTDFDDIDFPEGTISPVTKEKAGKGRRLSWTFSNLVSGFAIGMDMPKRINPGPLAAKMSLFAPVSLLFFFVWLFVITLLRRVELHPMNYLFLGAAFFAFHLLFSYTVDRIALETAFLIASAVSVFLVVSYLRLVVGLRFAAVEAGGAQLVYLVLFSYAHFYEGWTGLMVTIGSILTLFAIMQLTGRIKWTDAFARAGRAVPTAVPVEG